MDETASCCGAALLSTWSGHSWKGGLQIESVGDFRKIFVQTENTSYEITVICTRSGEILIRGGRFFPEFTPARLAGSTMGGSFLKLRGIYVGFNMEIHQEHHSVVTSRVRSIFLADEVFSGGT